MRKLDSASVFRYMCNAKRNPTAKNRHYATNTCMDYEETLCDALRFNLEIKGYDVDVAYSAEEAMEQVNKFLR